LENYALYKIVLDWLYKATEELLVRCWFETAGLYWLLLYTVSAVRWQTCTRCCLHLPLRLRK